jgi:cellulose synthase (UDP-forming)
MKIPAALRLSNGRSFACFTSDYSDRGVGLTTPLPIPVEVGEPVRLALRRDLEEYEFPAHVTLNQGNRIGLQLEAMNRQQTMDYIQCTFARADSWVVWGDGRKPDKPLQSLKEVVWMGLSGLKVLAVLLRGAWRDRQARLLALVSRRNPAGDAGRPPTMPTGAQPPAVGGADGVTTGAHPA